MLKTTAPNPPRPPSSTRPTSTSTLRQLLGPLSGVGTSPSKVHCASSTNVDNMPDDTSDNGEKKTSTSKALLFAKLIPTKSQGKLKTNHTPFGKEHSVRISSSGPPSSPCARRGSIPSLRRALSCRSSSSTSYFTAQQRRDSLDLIYKQSDNGTKYRPPIPHPLMEMAGGFDCTTDTGERDPPTMPSRARSGAQA